MTALNATLVLSVAKEWKQLVTSDNRLGVVVVDGLTIVGDAENLRSLADQLVETADRIEDAQIRASNALRAATEIGRIAQAQQVRPFTARDVAAVLDVDLPDLNVPGGVA